MKTVPCKTCPWRKGSKASEIPGFEIAKARHLSCTVGNGDGFRTIMACHLSDEGFEEPCIGYLAVDGWSNLNVRMGAIEGRFDMAGVWRDCQGIALFSSFEDMLANIERTYR